MAIGVLAWVAPSLAARVFGLGPETKQPIVFQLFGAREFVLGFLTATSSGTTRPQALRLGVMIDAADAAASLHQTRSGRLSTHGTILVGAGAALFAAIGAAATADAEDRLVR